EESPESGCSQRARRDEKSILAALKLTETVRQSTGGGNTNDPAAPQHSGHHLPGSGATKTVMAISQPEQPISNREGARRTEFLRCCEVEAECIVSSACTVGTDDPPPGTGANRFAERVAPGQRC